MSLSNHPAWKVFIDSFNGIAKHRHRYEVFRDFVTMGAIAFHNQIHPSQKLEEEYLAIIKNYRKEEVHQLCHLLSQLIILLGIEPQDVLGQLYMSLELGNEHTGQFFTPPAISELMARIALGDDLKNFTKPFITLSEPACGAGGMVLAFVKCFIAEGHNPAKRLWVEARDLDRTAALMCYLQLALWNVPAVVIVGNTLMMEAREVWYTPAHHLGFWGSKLRRHWERSADQEEEVRPPAPTESVPAIVTQPVFSGVDMKPKLVASPGQLGFEF